MELGTRNPKTGTRAAIKAVLDCLMHPSKYATDQEALAAHPEAKESNFRKWKRLVFAIPSALDLARDRSNGHDAVDVDVASALVDLGTEAMTPTLHVNLQCSEQLSEGSSVNTLGDTELHSHTLALVASCSTGTPGIRASTALEVATIMREWGEVGCSEAKDTDATQLSPRRKSTASVVFGIFSRGFHQL